MQWMQESGVAGPPVVCLAAPPNRPPAYLDDGRVAQVQDAGEELPDLEALLLVDSDDVEGVAHVVEHALLSAELLGAALAAAAEVVVLRGGRLQAELGIRAARAAQHIVEDVVVALPWHLVAHARLLQQVGRHERADERVRQLRRELQRDELAEARRVVVARGLGVAELLKNGRRVQDALRHACVAHIHHAVARGPVGEIGEHDLGGLGLTRPGLAADDDRLARGLRLARRPQVLVRQLRDGVRCGLA